MNVVTFTELNTSIAMTQSQVNYVTMTGVSFQVVDENNDIWKNNNKIVAKYATIKNTIDLIDIQWSIQGTNPKGNTTTKYDLWQDAANKSEPVCTALKAYYDDIDDEINYAKIDFSNTQFEYGSSTKVLTRMQLVHDTAADIAIADLECFDLEATDITDQQTAIVLFKQSIPKYKLKRTESKAATKELKRLFTLLKKQMKQFDTLIETKRKKAEHFVIQYFMSRRIVQYGHGHLTKKLKLKPLQWKSMFGQKYTIGDTLHFRNRDLFYVMIASTDTPDVLPTENLIKLEGKSEVRLEVPKDFGGAFGHWVVVINPHELDMVRVTAFVVKK